MLKRSIGVRLLERQGAAPLRGRVVVPLVQQLRLAAAEVLRMLGSAVASPREGRFQRAPPG